MLIVCKSYANSMQIVCKFNSNNHQGKAKYKYANEIKILCEYFRLFHRVCKSRHCGGGGQLCDDLGKNIDYRDYLDTSYTICLLE